MRSLRTYAAALTASVAAGLVVTGVAVGAPPLKLVSTDTLKVAAKEEQDDASASVFIINEGTESATVTVKFTASSPTSVTARATGSEQIPAGDVKSVNVKFTGLRNLETKVTGALVITGGATPLARPVEISPALHPTWNWPRDIVVLSLAAGLALALITVVWLVVETRTLERLLAPAPGPKWWVDSWATTLTRTLERLLAPAPGPKWSVDSWATTLTAAGAVFGTVLSSATLPEASQEIDKDTMVMLNLFFGLLLVAGPFVFQALRRPSASPLEQEGMAGTNLTLVVAACFIFAAVAGEIATLALLFWQLLGDDWQEVVKWTALLAEAVAVYYFLVTIPRVAAADWPAREEEAKKTAVTAETDRMTKFARILKAELGPKDLLPEERRSLVSELPEVAPPEVVTRQAWKLP